VVVLGRVSRDGHLDNVLDDEGADAATSVVVVDGDRGIPVVIALCDGDALHVVSHGADQRGVAGGDAHGDLPVTLLVGDLHPPGCEEGHHAVVTLGEGAGEEGEDDARTVGASGAHGYIVTHDGECV